MSELSVLRVGQVVRGVVGRYTVERELGAGSFGVAYLARRDGGEAVVLKQLRLEKMTDWKALELFEREARALASLSHPGIPRLYEFFALDGEMARAPGALYSQDAKAGVSLVIAQAYVEGRSLQAWIEGGGRWGAEDAEAVLRRLLAVLQYLHSRHPPVIHRDIKPANVVLGADGQAYLVDFGAIQDRLRTSTESGSTMIGSFGFFPMEQVLGKARPASDLYALGMTMMCALTHDPPDQLPLDEQTSKVIVRKAAPHLPDRLARALEAMLEPVIGQRADSVETVLAILDGKQAAAGPGALATRPGGVVAAAAGSTALVAVKPSVPAVAWMVPLVGGLGTATVVYGFAFNDFSERELVQVSYLWVPAVAFGWALRMAARDPGDADPLWTAVKRTGLVIAALVFFFQVVFPAL